MGRLLRVSGLPRSSNHPTSAMPSHFYFQYLVHLLKLNFRYLFYGHHLMSLSSSQVFQSYFHNSSTLPGFQTQSPPNVHCPFPQVHPHPDYSLCSVLSYKIHYEKCLPLCHAIVFHHSNHSLIHFLSLFLSPFNIWLELATVID